MEEPMIDYGSDFLAANTENPGNPFIPQVSKNSSLLSIDRLPLDFFEAASLQPLTVSSISKDKLPKKKSEVRSQKSEVRSLMAIIKRNC